MEDLESSGEDTKTWLERMHPFLVWKVVSPEFNNPFGEPMSTKVLIEFATKKDILLRHIELKGTVDGEEIIVLKNITRSIDVVTNHPAVSSMKKAEIKAYIDTSGVFEKIEDEIKIVQQKYVDELKRRKVQIPPT